MEIKVTLDVSSFLLSKGDIKNKKNNPLNAKILLAPVKNILSAPFPNIGNGLSNLSKSITNINVRSTLIKTIGVIIVFDFIIDFFTSKFATTATNKNIIIIKATG